MISKKKKLPELEHSETKKRTANEQTNKEKAKALLQIASKKQKNHYKSRQSFSKALNKVRADLPSSPQKQAAVIQKIAIEYGYQVRSHEENTIPEANREEIESFYYRTDIIYTMLGKQKVRKHHLTMFLREAYAFYLDICINEGEKCSFSIYHNL